MLLQALAAAALAVPPAKIHAVTLVPANGRLVAQLHDQVEKAHALHLRPIVLLTASWCPGCVELEHAMRPQQVVRAFRSVYVIKLDPRLWGDQFDQYNFYYPYIPIFDTVDDNGQPAPQHLGVADLEDVDYDSTAALAAAFEHFFASLPPVGNNTPTIFQQTPH